jgi:hypothetical protein
MAVINYEPLDATDVTTTKTLLHEAIPLTGTIVSGTYGVWPDDSNIKNYSHGMFQSIYDYPYLSSSANHIFDVTVGFNKSSTLSGSTVTIGSKKINMYNQFSQILLGYTGSKNTIRDFELDLKLDQTGSMKEAVFVNFSRLLTKDQVKKGSFSMTIGTGAWDTAFHGGGKTLTDASASDTQGTANTLGGDYGVLFDTMNTASGLIFYQAGIAVLSTGAFGIQNEIEPRLAEVPLWDSGSAPDDYNRSISASFITSSISGASNAFRHRIQNVSFNNTTEINSTIYFCRVPHNKYNYTSNPTYLSASQIVVKNIASDTPVTYLTTIGLYSSNNELLAMAKLSEPLKKTPSDELVLRVRLDY